MESSGQFHRCACGKIIWEDEEPKWFLAQVMKLFGKRVKIIFKEFKNKSSDNQRGYFRGVVVYKFAKALGYDPDYLYEILMEKFFPVWETLPDGSKKLYRRSYTSLDTAEAEWLHARVRELAAEWIGLYIELPNEPSRS